MTTSNNTRPSHSLGLRRLGFGNEEHTIAGRAVVGALGLLAIAESDARGYALRSRCDLVPDHLTPLELVRADGEREPLHLDRAGARALYQDAFERARQIEFEFGALRLTPSPKLVNLIRQSREVIREGKGA